MITIYMLPVSFVGGERYESLSLSLTSFLQPELTIPCWKTITDRKNLRSNLASGHEVSLTTDLWTALTTMLSYVTMTCHYIHDWEMQSAFLQTKAMPVTEIQLKSWQTSCLMLGITGVSLEKSQRACVTMLLTWFVLMLTMDLEGTRSLVLHRPFKWLRTIVSNCKT